MTLITTTGVTTGAPVELPPNVPGGLIVRSSAVTDAQPPPAPEPVSTATGSTLELPRPLEPWREWLALLAPELAEPLRQLLMHLHPLLGRMNAAVRSPDALPVGVGNIVRRGPYERMLISEWAYADAEPDEFIRRAAGNELLFTGPEPEEQRRSRLCIALFDAGPAQLGEPRLAQLALFILLARRAQEAGAQFQWGILQVPGRLHGGSGRGAIHELLNARTLERVRMVDVAAWDEHLIQLDAQRDTPLRDCWQLGAAQAPAMTKATARVTIDHSLLDDKLQLVVNQNKAVRKVHLPLPPSALGVRLLRHPFEGAVDKSRVGLGSSVRPSLKQAPRFAVAGQWLAAARVDGGAIVYHVPQSVEAPPGRPRPQNPPANGSILGANVFKKGFSTVVTAGDKLIFSAFPGPMSKKGFVCDRPPMEQFRAPPGMSRWLPTFFLSVPMSPAMPERVLMLDTERQLVCWEMTPQAQGIARFVAIADNVVGAEQFGRTLMYACEADGKVEIYRWQADHNEPKNVDTIGINDRCLRVFFSGTAWAEGTNHGLLAIQRSTTKWLIRHGDKAGNASIVEVLDDALVVGVAFPKGYREGLSPGLVVVHPDKKSIQLRTGGERIDIFKSELAIGQVSLDATGERIAWLLKANHELGVRHLHGSKPLLRVVVEGDANAN